MNLFEDELQQKRHLREVHIYTVCEDGLKAGFTDARLLLLVLSQVCHVYQTYSSFLGYDTCRAQFGSKHVRNKSVISFVVGIDEIIISFTELVKTLKLVSVLYSPWATI